MVYVHCWHLGAHESMAMWRGYGNGQYGIAVRSTFGLLNDLIPLAFGNAAGGRIFLGRVRYLDYQSESDNIPEEYNLYAPFVCKSLAYKNECEIRALFIDVTAEPASNTREQPPPLGHLIPVDKDMFQEVVVSPLAPSWFLDVVQGSCRQFDWKLPVVQSPVFGEPVF